MYRLADEYPQDSYPFRAYVDFIDSQERRIADYEDDLEIAATEYYKQLCELAPEGDEVALPDELISSWKKEAGIPLASE